MREHGPRAEAVLASVASGEGAPSAGFEAEVEIQVGRCDPLHLHAVVGELVAEERLHDERRVGEIPGVRVQLVLVADTGKEASSLDGETVREAERLQVAFLDLEAA